MADRCLLTSFAPAFRAGQLTRLEFLFTLGPPPAGPTIPKSIHDRVRPDFQGCYPVGLGRLFFPTHKEVLAKPQSLEPVRFYILRAVYVIWWYGRDPQEVAPVKIPTWIRYDVFSGASSYNLQGQGGNFQLNRWMLGMFPDVNCYDLAGIASLACNVLIDSAGKEIVDSRWIFQTPNGFIMPGPLIGWLQYPLCDNPFWGGNGM
jgi:hypothetical protein